MGGMSKSVAFLGFLIYSALWLVALLAMRRRQFSVRSMLIAMTLVSVGLGLAVYAARK